MTTSSAPQRVFLFLQGPHGPFFARLARMLQRAQAQVLRVGFNAGDRAFWPDRSTYIAYRDTPELWSRTLQEILDRRGITDIVLYGDTRPVHAEAVAQARARDLRIHVFEEGYMRPYWVTYERGGSNGNSRLMDLTVERMRADLEQSDMDSALPPASWGDMRQHVFYGALYHFFVLALNRGYRNFRPHRAITVRKEFALYLRRLLLMPAQAVDRRIATWRIRHGGFPFHLALLQLEHDSSFQMHSPFGTMSEFLETVVRGFAKGAPTHHHLVIKAHPLEDGRAPIRRDLRRLARAHGVADRVHFVRGGKLAQLLDEARSAVTVNSTAGQQVLWRGIPLKTFGQAVYAKPEFVSTKPLRLVI
ncbi:capsule biosynthesis protein CapA [Pelagivirga sediminicola]|uniref:Capsule biosynthesis protein CapA n=1 Tax=Pelagivirga sediminicola TaxID=2170575 RepID=A0A2T7G9K2_9RHOB|nr:capsule biosynthesis protein CapA [Pelagivirga sediminicola]